MEKKEKKEEKIRGRRGREDEEEVVNDASSSVLAERSTVKLGEKPFKHEITILVDFTCALQTDQATEQPTNGQGLS